MPKQLTREQLVKKGRQLRQAATFSKRIQDLYTRYDPDRKEIFFDTEYGKVRTLWYGLQDKSAGPVFFDIHGGGFVLGTADWDERMNLFIQKKVGCKVVSIDYAKAPDHPFPAAVEQIFAVVTQVVNDAEKYAVDAGRMAIGGHSAGGNLSTVACIRAKRAGRFQFRCQILDYPALDLFTDPYEKPLPKGAIAPEMAQVFNACYLADPEQAKDPLASPVFTGRDELQGLPPALFILAGRDSLLEEGRRYAQMLTDAGGITESYEYPDSIHGFTYDPSAGTTDALNKMAVFLLKYL